MVAKLIISYDGSRFFGSAVQPDKYTVQGEIIKALKILGIYSKVNFSGRTDKDVHATNQVVSFDLPIYWNDVKKLKIALEKILPNSIKIKHIFQQKDNFHARFSAKKRVYRYIISTKELNPFTQAYFHYIPKLDKKLIDSAIKKFIGTYDFKSFSKNGSEPNSTIRTIYSIKFYKYKEFFVFRFCANGYLRSQIRMMVDFLLKISDKKLTINDLQNQLENKKIISTTLAPPNGLYLHRVYYF